MAFLKQRRKGNDGANYSTAPRALFIPKALMVEYYVERVREGRPEIPEKCRGRPPLAQPPEVVRAMRAAHEFLGWTYRQVAAYFHVSASRACGVCRYEQGGESEPLESDAPSAEAPVVFDGRTRAARLAKK